MAPERLAEIEQAATLCPECGHAHLGRWPCPEPECACEVTPSRRLAEMVADLCRQVRRLAGQLANCQGHRRQAEERLASTEALLAGVRAEANAAILERGQFRAEVRRLKGQPE